MISHLLSRPLLPGGLLVTELLSEPWSHLTKRQHWFTHDFMHQNQTWVREGKRASNYYFQSWQLALKSKWASFYFKGSLS